MEPVPEDTHGPIAVNNRVYFGYGTLVGGVAQIIDRDKLLKGDPKSEDPFAPTAENLRYPQIGRADLYPTVGSHTTFPMLGMEPPMFGSFHEKTGKFRSGKPANVHFAMDADEPKFVAMLLEILGRTL